MIKFLEENIGVNLHDHGLTTSFLDTIPKAQMTKKKQTNWNSLKLKPFVLLNSSISEVLRKLMDGRKYLQIMSDNGLVSRIYQEFLQLNNKKIYSPIKNWANCMSIHFSEGDIWPVAHKKMLNISSHQGNTNLNHEIPLLVYQDGVIKKITNVHEYVEKLEPSLLLGI